MACVFRVVEGPDEYVALENCPWRNIVGGRDESEPLLRLADACAGFLRDVHEGQVKRLELLDKAYNCL